MDLMEKQEKWVNVSLRETILDDGVCGRHPYDYFCHVVHTEENPDVLRHTKIVYAPNVFQKTESETNIEYQVGTSRQKDSAFYANVLKDLKVRGYVGTSLPSGKT